MKRIIILFILLFSSPSWGVFGVSGVGNTFIGTGSFTTLGASGAVTLSPASAAVVISPTGTGTVTISPAGALTVNPTAASTINNTSIGQSTAAAGSFTALGASGAVTLSPVGAAVTLSPTTTGTVTINPNTAGAMDNMALGVTTPLAVHATTLGATGAVTLSPASAAVAISPSGTGTVAISPVGALTINPTAASTINNTSIGQSTAAAGSFTTLGATGATSLSGAVQFTGTKITTISPLAASYLTNGSMTSDITHWSGANWAWNAANGGEALHTTGATTALTSDQTVVSGQSYIVTYHVYVTSGTSVTMSFGGVNDVARTTSGTYTKYATATATTAMAFTPTSDFAGAVNLISAQPTGPVLTSCGTGPTLLQGSSSVAGSVVMGSGSPTACTLTFRTALTNTPSCVVTPTYAAFGYASAIANSGVTFTFSAGNATSGFSYVCIGLNE